MTDHTIPVLKKAIEVLREVAAGGETTAKGLAQQANVSRSTTYRILQTFLAEDWVRATADGRHELSVGLLPLLKPLRRHEALIETARPVLEKLAADTGLTAKLSVRDGDRALTLVRAESPRETSISVRVGAAYHLALGSSGAVLLADLDAKERGVVLDRAPSACWEHQKPADVAARIAECRRLGYCGDFGGYRPSVHAVSAPVRNGAGAVVGAFTLVGFAQDFEGRRRAAMAKHLLAAAAACGGNFHDNRPTSKAA